MRQVGQILAFMLLTVACLITGAAPGLAQGISYEVTEHVTNNRIVGWERSLTARDPNLAKWHWEPINTTAHNLDVRKVVDPTTANANAPVSKYAPSHYVKPIHVALPTVSHGVNGSARAAADLSGRLLRNNDAAPLMAQNKPAATYSDYISHEYSSVSNAAARTNVVGNIVHKSGRHSACNETPKYF